MRKVRDGLKTLIFYSDFSGNRGKGAGHWAEGVLPVSLKSGFFYFQSHLLRTGKEEPELGLEVLKWVTSEPLVAASS